MAMEYRTYNDNKLENTEIKSEKRFDQIKLYCDHSIVKKKILAGRTTME